MEEDGSRIAGYFKNKSVLVTGSTGFLGKSIYLNICCRISLA
jgi:FlaA1/EpsC-like NDP-sugar epimerase